MKKQKYNPLFKKIKGFGQVEYYLSYGWGELLVKLMDKIYPLVEKDNLFDSFEIAQVKEKFSGLRFYTNIETDEIHSHIREAEELSYHICETCGSLENIVCTQGWLITLCDSCAKKQDRKYVKRKFEQSMDELLIKWNFIKK